MRSRRKKNVLLKRSIKRNTNKRQRGGMDTSSSPFPLLETSSNTQGPMNISDLDSSQGPMNISELNITSPSEMDNTTMNTNDLSITNQQTIGLNNITTITPEANNDISVSTMDTDLSTLTGSTSSEEMSMTFGGKRTNKAKKTRKNKRTKRSNKTNKAKRSNKAKRTKRTKRTKRIKTRKNKRQRGGRGFTTSETTNPIAYKEDEYDQFKNALNYKL
jgi:hypothetical protein